MSVIVVVFVAVGWGCAQASACEEAFAEAAEVSDFEDSVSDLFPAVRACESVEEWVDASEAHPGAIDGADPRSYLENMCQSEVISTTDLCAEVSGGG